MKKRFDSVIVLNGLTRRRVSEPKRLSRKLE
jgi:hypothetical protein